MTNQAQISERIAKAQQAGFKDSDIYSTLANDKGFSVRIQQAKKSGFSDDQIAQQLGLKLNQPKQQKQEEFKHEEPSALVRFGHGMATALGGVVQAEHWIGDKVKAQANKHLGTNFDTKGGEKYTREMKAAEEEYQSARQAKGENGIDWWSLGGELAATAPVGAAAKGFQGVRVLSGAGAKVLAQNAAVGGAIGGAQFAENSDKRLSNIGSGAAGGAVGAVVADKAVKGASKVINAARGKTDKATQEVLDQAAQHGIRTSVGDASQKASIRRTETMMEQVPLVGMSAFREAQQNEVKQAANNIVDKLKGKVSDVDFKSLNKIQAQASAGDKNAIRILKIAENSEGDIGKTLQAAAEIKEWRGKQVASEMYDRVAKLAGNNPVTPNKTLQAIDNAVAKDSKLNPNNELLKELQSIQKNITNPDINVNYMEMRNLRSRLGEMMSEWGRSGKSTSQLTNVRSAVENDLRDFARNSGNSKLINESQRADALYKELLFGKDREFAKALQSDKPDEIFTKFVKVGKGDRAKNFYQNLDPKGQAALRYEMANRALDKATNTTGIFSPAKFALEFEKMHAPYSHVFSGAEKAEMDGFVKLMRHVERAGQYAENPANGSRVAGVLIGGTAVASLPIAIKAAGASAIAKALFTTKAGKRLLLASKDLPSDSPKLKSIIDEAEKLAVRSGALASQQ